MYKNEERIVRSIENIVNLQGQHRQLSVLTVEILHFLTQGELCLGKLMKKNCVNLCF